MSLSLYRKKRSFTKTPEPTGGKSTDDALLFVIQKHDASHLHYDFRLEMAGVLKSWAVPKGPSTDPSVKRLAMMVEDHPFDYRTFEGVIPKGQYGGGTVMVWDEGTYEPMNEYASKKEAEKDLLKQLHKGKIMFQLHGKKLKGAFALVKSSYQGENSWLLMKAKDKYAKETDITKKEKSVQSGRSLSQIEKDPERIYGQKTIKPGSTAKKAAAKKSPVTKAGTAKKKAVAAPADPAMATAGRKEPFPLNIAPMLATLVDKPFDAEGWLYEIKWDGYRALAYLNRGEVEIKSRNNKSFNEKFYPVYDALKKLDMNAVLDGEIIVAGENGISNFGNLQNWRSEADGELLYYVFDLLWYHGYSLMGLPLSERRAKLVELLPESEVIRISQAYATSGTEFFEAAGKLNLEGIMAKKEDAVYVPGARSKEWLKIKANKRHEVVIGGYTINEDTSKLFSALLVGVFEKGKLHYTGKVGTGFNEKIQQEIMQAFGPLEQKEIPFDEVPDVNKPSRFRPNPPHATVVWLKPQLVCEVAYAEITSDGVMRHPSFKGMREDKKAKDVHTEKAVAVEKAVKQDASLIEKNKMIKPVKTGRKTLLNPGDETQVRVINRHELKFTNLSKIFWPKEKISKRDLINYYYQVAPVMLPYLKDRPQSLNRHPNGIAGESFYQKDVTGKVPEWIDTFPYHSEADDKDRNFMVCTDESSLLYIASLGCIEMNPWSSTIQSPDKPDWCIIDLDPDNNTFDSVIEAALVTKDVLDSVGVPSYPKTSGSTGMHIYIPLAAKYTYEQSKEFARVIVKLVYAQIPSFTSIERATRLRKGKLYLDFLQNRPQATLAAPYSVRPKPGATVSAPLSWDEVKPGLKMKDFNIFTMTERLQTKGDLFKPVLGKGINMNAALKKLSALVEQEEE
ncbi:MAG TPA: DNA ligase D [Panacibacter sp.]|nr:DNA ligase D [Panacibacter sp.]HNP45485.1 DNA ligase D [Panacibacter sp.]